MLSHLRDSDQFNVLPLSSETGIGTRPGGRTSWFDINPPVPIPPDQSRLTKPIGGFDLLMVQCSVPE